MKHTNIKVFIKYVNEHAPFIEFINATNGTMFLSIGGCDGGNVFADGLEGNQLDGKMNIPFTDTKAIDEFIADAAYAVDCEEPKVTYTEYCK